MLRLRKVQAQGRADAGQIAVVAAEERELATVMVQFLADAAH